MKKDRRTQSAYHTSVEWPHLALLLDVFNLLTEIKNPFNHKLWNGGKISGWVESSISVENWTKTWKKCVCEKKNGEIRAEGDASEKKKGEDLMQGEHITSQEAA